MPHITERQFAKALKLCHVDVFENATFVRDYVAVRSLGLHSQELLRYVPDGQVAFVLADLHLHCVGVAGSLRCAAKRGVAMSFNAVQDFQKTRRGKVRVLTVEQLQQDA